MSLKTPGLYIPAVSMLGRMQLYLTQGCSCIRLSETATCSIVISILILLPVLWHEHWWFGSRHGRAVWAESSAERWHNEAQQSGIPPKLWHSFSYAINFYWPHRNDGNMLYWLQTLRCNNSNRDTKDVSHFLRLVSPRCGWLVPIT